MDKENIMLITGTSKGIGSHLVKHFIKRNYYVIGCSRNQINFNLKNYKHYVLDINDEIKVKKMFKNIRNTYGRLDVLINNAGIASMNHSLLTEMETVYKVLNTNVAGTFLFIREAAKLMQIKRYGRIVNFGTIATPLNLEGEAIYASSKAAVISLTKILSKELANFGITINAIGPTPIKTDLIKSVPKQKLINLINNQSIKRYGSFEDVINVIDFFISSKSDFINGQVIYLGGI
jgi:3-oxoacyl-[acyl-carrier protein] reductase